MKHDSVYFLIKHFMVGKILLIKKSNAENFKKITNIIQKSQYPDTITVVSDMYTQC